MIYKHTKIILLALLAALPEATMYALTDHTDSLFQFDMGIKVSLNHSCNAHSYRQSGYGLFYDTHVSASTHTHNGTVWCNSFMAHAGTFCGTGTINCKAICIVCDDCTFTGTINCSSHGTIYCKKLFDYHAIKKQGSGPLTIIISPEDGPFFGKEQLVSTGFTLLMNSSANSIDEKIKQIRQYAAYNSASEEEIFQGILANLDAELQYLQEHKDDNYDKRALKPINLSGSAAALTGAATCYYAYHHNRSIITAAGVAASALAASSALYYYYRYLNPQHANNIEHIIELQKRIGAARATPYEINIQKIVLK